MQSFVNDPFCYSLARDLMDGEHVDGVTLNTNSLVRVSAVMVKHQTYTDRPGGLPKIMV